MNTDKDLNPENHALSGLFRVNPCPKELIA